MEYQEEKEDQEDGESVGGGGSTDQLDRGFKRKEDQEEGGPTETGFKRRRGSGGRGINRNGVSRGVEDQEEGELGRRSTGEGYQEEKRIKKKMDQQERGIKRSRGSRRRWINRRGVSRGEEDQEEDGSTGEGYQEE